MATMIKSQAYNDWKIPSKELARIILNFIEKVKIGGRYFDKYKGYEIQLTDDSKVLLIGDIVQGVVSKDSNDYDCNDYDCNDYDCNDYDCNDYDCNDYDCNDYDWCNHKRGILKVFNVEKRQYEFVSGLAMKPIPSWFNKMCEVLADK